MLAAAIPEQSAKRVVTKCGLIGVAAVFSSQVMLIVWNTANV